MLAREAKGTVRVGRQASVEGRAKVVVVELQPGEGGPPVGPGHGGFGRLSESEGPAPVGVLRRCALAFLDQPIATVFADRLEQPVAGLCGRVVERDQGLVDELAEQAEDVPRADARPGAYDLRGLERRSTDEGRQRPEHAALRVREQVVAPIQGGLERLLA